MSMKALFPSLLLALLSVAANAEPLDVFRDCATCPEMIELPMGEFVMGAPDDEFRKMVWFDREGAHLATAENPYIPKNEGPQHEVTVDIPIAMGRTEITYDEWMACVNEGGCGGYVPDGEIARAGSHKAILRSLSDDRFVRIPSETAIARALDQREYLRVNGRYPVIYVSYLDAQAYVGWLNRKLGTDAYRLPTEAEWEYAARAGTTTRFSQGFEPTGNQENISGEATELALNQVRPDLRNLGYPVPVDELDAANPWGLRHMAGNVAERTLSCYFERYQGWSTTSKWLAKSYGERCERVVRGGSFFFPMDTARSAFRIARSETSRPRAVGFRVVKELD